MQDLIRQGRTIRLHVFRSNLRAQRFYESLGFFVDPGSHREHHVAMVRFGEGMSNA
jgi:hypothetical protein